jgi:hypothetical protein
MSFSQRISEPNKVITSGCASVHTRPQGVKRRPRMSEPLLSQPSREAKARHGRHWMMIGMVAGNYAMMDLNTVLLYFMLSEVSCQTHA